MAGFNGLGGLLGAPWALLGRSWAFLGRFWAFLGASWASLARFWSLLSSLGRLLVDFLVNFASIFGQVPTIRVAHWQVLR